MTPTQQTKIVMCTAAWDIFCSHSQSHLYCNIDRKENFRPVGNISIALIGAIMVHDKLAHLYMSCIVFR